MPPVGYEEEQYPAKVRAELSSGKKVVEIDDSPKSCLIHELVHALAETPRWEHLNYETDGWRHNRTEFLEAVASLAGKFFRSRSCQ